MPLIADYARSNAEACSDAFWLLAAGYFFITAALADIFNPNENE